MQVIYVDVFILINIFEDYLFLICLRRISRSDKSLGRLTTAAVTGGFLSLTALLGINGFIVNLIITVLTAGLMVLIAFGYNKFFLKNTLTLIVISFLFSGAVMFFCLALKPSGAAIINNRVYFNISPILLIILTIVVYSILFFYNKYFKNRSSPGVISDVTIYYSDFELTIKCKTDTGMNVKEPFSGSNVIIVAESVCGNIIIPESRQRIIPYKSLGGSGIIRAFKADRVLIDGNECLEPLYIGISNNIFDNEIGGLIPPEIAVKKDDNHAKTDKKKAS